VQWLGLACWAWLLGPVGGRREHQLVSRADEAERSDEVFAKWRPFAFPACPAHDTAKDGELTSHSGVGWFLLGLEGRGSCRGQADRLGGEARRGGPDPAAQARAWARWEEAIISPGERSAAIAAWKAALRVCRQAGLPRSARLANRWQVGRAGARPEWAAKVGFLAPRLGLRRAAARRSGHRGPGGADW